MFTSVTLENLAVMGLGETGMIVANGAGLQMRNVGVSAHHYSGSKDNTALLIEDCFELYFARCPRQNSARWLWKPLGGLCSSRRTLQAPPRHSLCCSKLPRVYVPAHPHLGSART